MTDNKTVSVSPKLDIVEVDTFPDAPSDDAKKAFDAFEDELNQCVYAIVGKNLDKKKVQKELSKKVRKVVAKFFNIQFFEAGQVYIVKSGLNYVVKIRQDEEFITLLRIHEDELKEKE